MLLSDSLTPINDLTQLDTGTWLSEGQDPAFEINKSEINKLRHGWYLLRVQVEAELPRYNSKLYVDYGEGYSEKNSFILNLKNGKAKNRIIRFKKSPRRIRFDPMENNGEFRVHILELKRIPYVLASFKMLYRLHGKADWVRSFFGLGLRIAIARDAKNQKLSYRKLLYKKYNQKFKIHQNFTYQEWIESVEKPLIKIKKEKFNASDCANGPKISIILPTFNTNKTHLIECIDSVVEQWYENWELCIADDASTEPYIRELLIDYAKKDSRIKLVFRETNGHISQASNSALEIAEGDYVALLDHDDLLVPHALYLVFEAITDHAHAKIIYSDEDKITNSGTRLNPHFKPDWNLELLLGINYVCHMVVYKKEVLSSIGGFRTGYEGSQDFDLILRAQEQVPKDEIIHIPSILYHWRISEGSTALDVSEKSYAHEAGIKAVNDYLQRAKPSWFAVDGPVPTSYRVSSKLGSSLPLVSVIIPTKNALELTRNCVESVLKKSTYQNIEIIIVNNQSDEQEVLDWLDDVREHSKVTVLDYEKKFNFSAICNYAVNYSSGEFVCLLNNDIEVLSPCWIEEMLTFAMDEQYGCVGAKLYYPDGKIQHGGVILGIGGTAGHAHKHFPGESVGYFGRLVLAHSVSAVTGACLMVRKVIYKEVGGLDEEKFAIAFNDIDFCLKVLNAGYVNIWTPHAELTHYESATRGYEDTPEKIQRFKSESSRFIEKWGADYLDSDPTYNVNLTRTNEDFSLRAAIPRL